MALATRLPDKFIVVRCGLYHCRFPDAVILLDLVPDRYRLLTGQAAARFARLVEHRASPDDVDWLGDRGIRPESLRSGEQSRILAPTRNLDHGQSGSASSRLTIKAAWLQHQYRRRLKSRPLYIILEEVEAKRRAKQPGNDETLVAIAEAFERAVLYASIQDRCLPRSLAMAHMLWQAGIDAQLVFGVTMPFAAHCWVQHRGTLLSDPIDRVLAFKPIMVVG